MQALNDFWLISKVWILIVNLVNYLYLTEIFFVDIFEFFIMYLWYLSIFLMKVLAVEIYVIFSLLTSQISIDCLNLWINYFLY